MDENWEKSISPKVLNLAERLATEAQRHSQWHKRMNAHNLNQSGAKVEDKGLTPGDLVYFYKLEGVAKQNTLPSDSAR